MSDTTISDVINSAGIQFTCAGVEDPFLNVRVLVGPALGLAPDDVPNHTGRVLTEEEISFIGSLIDRRARHRHKPNNAAAKSGVKGRE